MALEIVGREAEVAALQAFFAEAAAGARAFVLEGDAGIGKSTLWLAGVDAARDRGLRVLSARPAEVERGLAYAALGDLLGECALEVLDGLSSPRRNALRAALLLEGGDESSADSRVLGVAVHSVLVALAERGPIVVAIDDCQWLDVPSADALAFALRRLQHEPLQLLLARRGDHSAELERALPAEVARLRVGPLSLGATHKLVRDRLERTFSRPTMLRLHEVSGGNPFYALELARALDAVAGPIDPSEPLPVPESLDHLIRERLRRLPGETRDALLVVAVIGAPSLELVRDAGIAVELLAPAVAEHVLELAGGEARFVHPLLASGVIAGATDAERRSAHRLVATAVDDPVARARHVAAALEEPDVETARLLEEAAELARSRGAPSVAAELGEAAARATFADREDDRRRRIIAAAEDHLAAGSAERAFVLGRALLERAAPGRPRAEALTLLGKLEGQTGTIAAAVQHGREALVEASGIPELELVIHRQLAYDTRLVEGLDVAQRHGQAAVRIAEQLGYDVLTAKALSSLAIVRFNAGEPDALGLAERALLLAQRFGDTRAIGEARVAYVHCLVWSGRIDESRRIASDLLAAAESDDPSRVNALFYLCLVEERAGRLELARAYAEQMRELAFQEGGAVLADAPPLIWSLARVAAYQGEVELARELAERALAHPDARAPSAFSRSPKALLALLDAWAGDPARAVERFAAIEAQARADGSAATASYLAEYVEALLELGRLDDARAVLALWERDSRKLGHRWAIPQTVRCRGLTAAAEGDVAAAVKLLSQAVAEHEAVGDPLGRARALLALGVTRRRARQKRAAREAIEAALAGFEEIGAAGWAEKARNELGRIGGRQRDEGLTPAERRVANLVAEGKTNREVAAALFLGERTVASHLTHIYAKLGVRSRTELVHRLQARTAGDESKVQTF